MSISDQHPAEQIWLLTPGPLLPFVRQFTEHHRDLGYNELTVKIYGAAARHFAHWLQRSKIPPEAIDNSVIERFARHRCRCPGGRKRQSVSFKYVNRVRRFVRFLRGEGVVPPLPPEPASAADKWIAAFEDWCRSHRGITERTINGNRKNLKKILLELGDDPNTYDAALIRRVMLAQANRHKPCYTQRIASTLRSYLRFLAAQGECRAGLDGAVPRTAEWKLSSLPRYISPTCVEKVIASCDLAKPHGIRNRAILLLLARLGLRPGDVMNLRLDDISWGEGTLRLCGKGRRETHLPLPQDAGEAVLAYLQEARPPVDDPHVFLRSCAPFRPFNNSYSVSSIVTRALTQAGITGVPRRGAYLLRHSAATNMLRGGATLDAVGAVLRHRLPHTTAIYAKVDIVMLQQVAQPWPGGASC